MITSLIKKYKTQLGDSLFSIMGLVLMNAVAQILLYPLLARIMGEAGYGDMQYLMAYVNVITVSVGCAVNLARITTPADTERESNGDYHLFLLAVCVLGIPFCLFIQKFGGVEMDLPTTLTYYLLFVAMAFRYYADVVYKLTLNYRRYFLYYLAISLGYVLGAFLFRETGIWPLAILTGEALGVLFAYLTEPRLRKRAFRLSENWRHTLRIILTLCLSEGLANLIFNADRLMLKLLINASAVTVYYLATLVGKTMSLVTTPLNGVLLGYLARYEGGLTRRMMKWVLIGSLAAILLFTGVCVVGGLLMLYLLYPAELAAVRPYLLAGSLAQVLFFTTSIVTVILVRFANKAYQVYINGLFGICFFGLGIPATLWLGIWGFAIAMIVAAALRWLLAILLGFYTAHRAENTTAEELSTPI